MIVVDYNQTAIGSFMAEVRGRSDVEVSIPLLRHMIVNTIRSYKAKWGNDYGDLVIACDNRHYWRRDFYPYYKAGRKRPRGWKSGNADTLKTSRKCYYEKYPI